jgi:hypothetical protein
VLNKGVRRSALWTYLTPLILFFAGVAVIFAYWGTSPPVHDRDVVEPAAKGATGTERARSGEQTPGGHNPDPAISSPKDEVEHRAGRIITELDDVFENNGRDAIGRRIELRDVEVERVESPTLFWVRDGNARAAVASGPGIDRVRAGQSINVFGTVERSDGSVRISASRVEPTR